MTKRKTKYLSFLMAAVCLIAAISMPAYAAKSIEEQMAANSAAWIIANNAGDKATCDALHAANVALAAQAAGSSGTASYNSSKGTWDITTSSGSKITSSSSSSGGKTRTSTYTTTTKTGKTSSAFSNSYSSNSINAYKSNGGTNEGLTTSYNNAATAVTSSGDYGTNAVKNSAAEEVAVVQALLGLTNAQARKLQADLESSKQEYQSAQAAYEAAVAAGDTAAAAKAQERMTAAHNAAEAARSEYNYTGDTSNVEDGGYYDGTGNPSPVVSNGGGFYVVSSCKITASCNEGGAVTPNGVCNVEKYTDKEFKIEANDGYEIQSVLIDDVDKGKLESYKFERVTANHTISAYFVKKTYSISASASTGGTISPSGTVDVKHGENKTFTVTPNTGYVVQAVTVDGVNKGAITSYTFSNVTGAHTISASFVKKTYSISASAGTGGSISPSGSISITHGDSKTFAITPSTGYEIQSVTVDGQNKGKISSYTFSSVTGGHTISAVFVKKTYTLTASASTGGSISPGGNISISHGDSKTFTITPAQGYKITNVTVDGTSKGPITSYTFSNVTSAHSISATFAPSGEVKLSAPGVTDSSGGSIGGGADGGTIKSGYGIYARVPVAYHDVSELRVVMNCNFGGQAQTVTLQETSHGVFELPVNSQSPTGQRSVYIPVSAADGSYTLTFTVTARNAAGALLTDTKTATVTVRGSMYEDDFTGDS